ncbi:MAG: hypothetical protein AABX48_01610 [Nanoarchaeota archaeon]
MVKFLIFYVDRLERGVKVMQDLGLRSHAVVPLDENAWKILKRDGVISDEIYRNLMERIEGQDAWAERMLKSEKGMNTLIELFKKDRRKAMNVYSNYEDSGNMWLEEELRINGINVKLEEELCIKGM